ncbi:MAG: RsmB/NOP family class I SAM-dependent RNA methyltransferase, partial [Acholeplasmatales bacterium]|nr:RsmB/NOP family class I SAM-dependent RNA methyltransferase [Acholeplasmatales bacterium]
IKYNSNDLENYLNTNSIEYEKGIVEGSYIILNKTANDLYNTEIVENGYVYLQSLSSMLPPIYLEPKENEIILDMAAAPGGKTTQIASMTNDKSQITAIEKDKIRCERLKYNINKQGIKNTFVMNQDAKNLDDFFSFDRILLDAPCSGSGTLYIGVDAKPLKISDQLVINSAKIQLQLLKKALKILKKGGTMIYSTCSILKDENEDILKKALPGTGCEIVPIDAKDLPLLPSTIPGVITVMPTDEYEGFFVAKIKKN